MLGAHRQRGHGGRIGPHLVTEPLDVGKRRSEAVGVSLLVLAALAVRVGYLVAVTRRPGFKWIDPDRYAELGSLLARGEDGWRWTLDAVLYLKHVKAPLYPVILSRFALLPAPYPFSAAVAQAVASAACVGFLFVIGRGLHSARAGFIAAALYTICLPSIFDVAVIQQESFEVLARRARQRLLAALPRAREAALLHFAPAPPPSVSLLVLHALALLSGVLWAHALRSDVLPPAVVSLGSRTWLVLAVLWLAVRTGAPTRRG